VTTDEAAGDRRGRASLRLVTPPSRIVAPPHEARHNFWWLLSWVLLVPDGSLLGAFYYDFNSNWRWTASTC